MEEEATKTGKVIGNVGILDIRKATEASVAEIQRVGNVGSLLYSPETAALIPKLNIGNLGGSVEVPLDARLLTGQVTVNRNYFKDQAEPLNLVVVGQMFVETDVEAEDIERGLGQLVVSGQILCPEHVTGAIQSKLRDLTGQMQAYGRYAKLAIGKLTLDEHYLRALEDETDLLVLGKLSMPQVLDNGLLAQKVRKIQVLGRIACREENVEVLLSRLADQSTARVSSIPVGFEPIEHALVLGADTVEGLPGRKLYCTGTVRIEPDVAAEALDEALEALVVKGVLLCPAALRKVIARKCNLLETQAVFYEGELWLVEDKLDLLASRFDYLEGKATLVVQGKVSVAQDIEPGVLAERLAKVHNFGKIRCTPEQMGAIQARLGTDEGKLEDSTKEGKPRGGQENAIGNVGTLRL